MFAVLSCLRKVVYVFARGFSSRERRPALPGVPAGGFTPRLRAPAVAAVMGLALAACEPGAMTAPGSGTGPRVDSRSAVPVALLVPGGSGDSSNELIARNLENAARMAISDLQGVQIDLRVYQTGGRSQGAADAATRAVAEGAQIILGPVFGDSARAAGEAVAARNIPVLSFSNNTEVAGGNVYVLGPTFANTANRLASHAVREGKGRILIVHERNTAGELGRRAIEAASARSGATIAAVRSFEFSQQGVVEALSDLVDGARESGAQSVFFTSDTAGALPLVTRLMSENRAGPDQFQYIGLTRWDIPPSTLELSGVQGAWFALPDPGLTSQFAARYAARHGSEPLPIAGLAYDGIAAIGALVGSGRSDAFSRAALTQGSGFAGVNGVFRFLQDGTNERGLAIAEIRAGEVVVIDPAPRAFVGPGF